MPHSKTVRLQEYPSLIPCAFFFLLLFQLEMLFILRQPRPSQPCWNRGTVPLARHHHRTAPAACRLSTQGGVACPTSNDFPPLS